MLIVGQAIACGRPKFDADGLAGTGAVQDKSEAGAAPAGARLWAELRTL
jgi:hypothetical protein